MVKLYNGWTLRYRQEECHDKCVKAYFAHSKEFLIAAVCRFGKTITTLQTLKDIADGIGSESEAILVLCTMSVTEEWKDAAEATGFNSTYCSIPVNDIDFESIGPKGRHVVYVSTQKLGNGSDKSLEIIRWFNSHEGFKAVVYDECHLGSGTMRTKGILDQLEFDFKVYLSGTPYREHLRQEFGFDSDKGEASCYIYSMTDEYEDYKNGLLDYIPVKLEMSILDYQKEIENAISEEDNDKFTQRYGVSSKYFKKLFSEPSMKPQAKEFFDKIVEFCHTKDIHNGLFYVPIRKVGRDLIKLAKKMGVEIEFKSLCGGSEDEEADMSESDADMLNAFYSAENPNGKIRIGVTCNKCGTGTTLRELEFVAFLKETTNAISFIQQSQRCRTQNEAGTKAVGYVLCFNQWSGLKAFRDYAEASYDQDKTKKTDANKIKAAMENGALSLTLNMTDNIDYEYVIDILSSYHPGDELFTEEEISLWDGFDFDGFGISIQEAKEAIIKRHPNLRDNEAFQNVKSPEAFVAALQSAGLHEEAKNVKKLDIAAAVTDAFVNLVSTWHIDYGMSVADIKNYDSYDEDLIGEVETEMHMSIDCWKNINSDRSTNIAKVCNYADKILK